MNAVAGEAVGEYEKFVYEHSEQSVELGFVFLVELRKKSVGTLVLFLLGCAREEVCADNYTLERRCGLE